MSTKHVLVVEDERDLAEILVYNLQRAGYQVRAVHDGAAALAACRERAPDLILLDVMLPKASGIEVARQLRADPRLGKTPILMLTARAEEADQLTGLNVGADDYVTKPFSMRLLMARVGALLRRTVSTDPEPGQLKVGAIEADLNAHVITASGSELKLTLTEFKILVALLQFPRRVLSRNDLIARVMGPGIVVTARTIDVHVAAIRKKLGPLGGMIRTIRGVGYQLSDEIEATASAEIE
jgi:two-component system phosphate regulon response regulator PhoB